MASTDNTNPSNPPNIKELVSRARAIYDGLKPTLEPASNGKYVVIEVSSGRHFIGDTKDEAMAAARTEFPHALMFVRRIGELEKASRHFSSPSVSPTRYAGFL